MIIGTDGCGYYDLFLSLQLDRTVSLEQYGFVVAADALGQLIFSPIFGLIADRLDSIRLVSLICCLTFSLGNALYANVSLVSADLLGRAFDMVTKEVFLSPLYFKWDAKQA